ncbi:MAG: sulfite exporter TauE/SafE family protein [Dialister invisus]
MDLLAYIIICPLVFLAGFVDAVAGGGGLISLPAYIIAGIPVHNSIATNKLSSCMGTLLTTGKFAKDGLIPWKPALAGVIFAFAGSSLGAPSPLFLTPVYSMTAMLFILPSPLLCDTKEIHGRKRAFPFQKTVLLSCTYGVCHWHL